MYKFFEEPLMKFADWALNTPLLELAQQRNVATDKIESLSKPLNDHLFKLYVMQKSTYRNHWTEEIHNFLDQMNDISWGKKRNKFRSYDYFKWIFEYYFYDNNNKLKLNLNKNLKNILEKYQDEFKINWSVNEFKNMSESFCKYFSQKIENGSYLYEDLEKYLGERFIL